MILALSQEFVSDRTYSSVTSSANEGPAIVFSRGRSGTRFLSKPIPGGAFCQRPVCLVPSQGSYKQLAVTHYSNATANNGNAIASIPPSVLPARLERLEPEHRNADPAQEERQRDCRHEEPDGPTTDTVLRQKPDASQQSQQEDKCRDSKTAATLTSSALLAECYRSFRSLIRCQPVNHRASLPPGLDASRVAA